MIKTNTKYLTKLALLAAIELVLVITPLGFLPIPGFALTLVHIPVIIGAIVLGVKAGVFLGAIYGVASLITATTRMDLGSLLFTPAYTKSWLSVVLAVVPRLIFPIVTALLYKALMQWNASGKRFKDIPIDVWQRRAAGIAAAVGTLTNTVLVLGGIYLFFAEKYTELYAPAGGALAALALILFTNGIVEAVIAALVAIALVKPLTADSK